MLLRERIEMYQEKGFYLKRAKVKVCSDIFMTKIARSAYQESVTFKGGTIMYELTKERRRSTKDLDIDMIKTSINDENLIRLLNEVGRVEIDSGIYFVADLNSIEELKHEDYHGKRIILNFYDEQSYHLTLTLDIGVHKFHQIIQDTMLFDVITKDQGIRLLVNPIEQIIVEKSSSFIRYGIVSTRMKDLFDMYYLVKNEPYDINQILQYIDIILIREKKIKSFEHYSETMISVLKSSRVRDNLSRSENWIEVETRIICDELIQFFKELVH